MKLINILTIQQKYKRGFNDFYPIFKWAKEFKEEGIEFKFFKYHTQKNIQNCDILIIDTRYPGMIVKGHYKLPSGVNYINYDFIIDFINTVKAKQTKVVLYDASDGASGSFFNITPYVDIHLKKQMYKDKNRYQGMNEYNFMPWLPKGENMQESKIKNKKFTPLKSKNIDKLKLGWNIGMCDYRAFPLKKYYPIGTSALLNNLYKNLNYKTPSSDRKYLLSYRGSSNRFPSYDYQRNLVLTELKKLELVSVIVGGKVPFKQYIKEQENSKISISPFGWGEVCYRDFESIVNGCLLVKPDMSHLETFPDLYTKETHLPFSWDASDLVSIIERVKDNYSDYLHLATNAQSVLKTSQTDSNTFIQHFKKNVL